MNSARLLKIIFVILLLVTAGELAYYVYIQFNIRKDVTKDDASIARTQINIPTLLITEATEKTKNVIPTPRDERTKEYFEWLQKKNAVMVSSVMIDQSEGEITELDSKGDVNKGYKLKISIKGKSQYSFYFNESELPLIKTVQLKVNNEEVISLNELKIGDKITIKETFDTMTDSVKRIDTKISKK